jgi:DNA-binding IclR family transcriptional regulator
VTLDPETLAAIAACVRSIEELEVLLRLADNRARYCSAVMIATETGLPPAAASAALETLASRNLLDVRITDAVLYKLDPASPEVRARLERTLDAAWRNRGDVLRAIVRRPSAAQDFADAFRMRKDRRDG